MSTGLIEIMKRASIDAQENSKPTDLRYGTVKSISPLSITITNNFTLPASVLVVPEYLTDHEVEVSMNWSTDYSGTTKNPEKNNLPSSVEEHQHDYEGTINITGRKKLKIYNGLKVGDKVALLRQQGGQSYFVLDRV